MFSPQITVHTQNPVPQMTSFSFPSQYETGAAIDDAVQCEERRTGTNGGTPRHGRLRHNTEQRYFATHPIFPHGTWK